MKKLNGQSRMLSTVAALVSAVLVLPIVADAGVLNPAPVAKTGQTESYRPGDDGDLEAGVAWPDPRFIDNLNGTVTDHLTGLVWLKDATRLGSMRWNPALAACNGLADDGAFLTDGSIAGDWRLPNNRELRSLIDFSRVRPALPPGNPFNVPVFGAAWTSTSAINNTGRAWTIEDGVMVNDPKGTLNWVWPVRDGEDGVGPAPVPKTGQTITYGAGDDGDLEKGVAWPEPRFTDNQDGTVTDNLTGLIWLTDATRFSDLNFSDALETCNTLADDGVELTDGSLPGDWRLPNVSELGSLSHYERIGPSLPDDHPFVVANAATFWSSTTYAGNTSRAFTLGLGIGRFTVNPKVNLNQAWPVRGANPVYLDIKPGSCPNPYNVKAQGMLPVAILGTADFDVTSIDPVTIRLEGVAPVRSSLEDVGTPTLAYRGKEDCHLDCTEEGPDGWLDLTLKFSRREITAALGDSEWGECRMVTLTGHLTPEAGGTPIEGEDVVVMVGVVKLGDGDRLGRGNRVTVPEHPGRESSPRTPGSPIELVGIEQR